MRLIVVSATDEGGGGFGVRGREGGPLGVEISVPRVADVPFFFLSFLGEDSLPLASERLGEPGRFNEAEDLVGGFRSGGLGGRRVGVLVPLEEAPDGGLPLSFSEGMFFFSSASFLICSSLRRSASVSDDSLCITVSTVTFAWYDYRTSVE